VAHNRGRSPPGGFAHGESCHRTLSLRIAALPFQSCGSHIPFGSLIGRALGQQFDDEVLYIACILHDLGLTERYQGKLPFEIQGAQAAKSFLIEHSYAADKAEMVWDGIAMHPSPIGSFKRMEIRLVGAGAGADVIAPDPSHIENPT
jgi:hypothetical protein